MGDRGLYCFCGQGPTVLRVVGRGAARTSSMRTSTASPSLEPPASRFGRIDHPDSKTSTIEPAIASEQRLGMMRRMRADQKVGDEALAGEHRRLSAAPPESARKRSSFECDGLEANSEDLQGLLELRVRGEVRTDFRPDDLAGHEGPSVVRCAH